jgi:hypothetical protein
MVKFQQLGDHPSQPREVPVLRKTGRCTALGTAVTSPDSSLSAEKRQWHWTSPGGAPPSQWRCISSIPVTTPTPTTLGHIQVGIALGVAVPPRATRYSWPPQPVTATGVAVPPGQQPEPGFSSSSSPTSSLLQICQHHQVFTNLCACVSFSQTFPKGLVTQFSTPLDPSNDAKLDHSSGTR